MGAVGASREPAPLSREEGKGRGLWWQKGRRSLPYGLGLVGEGPFYLVLRPQALDLWWPRVEALLPQFPKRYEVRWYPDRSWAVVAWDLGQPGAILWPSRSGTSGC